MANMKGQMSDATFRELTKQDYWIQNIAYATACYDKGHVFKHHRTVTYPDEYIVTEEQIAEAKHMAARRHDELLAGIKPGELVFCAMGMDYQSKHEGGVNNHRIRCNFRAKDGHRYFIEFCQTENYWSGAPGTTPKNEKGDWFFIDFSIDLDRRDENRRLQQEIYERRKAMKTNRERMSLPDVPQDEYNAKGVEKMSYCIPFTWANVLDFVNKTYGCTYTSARMLRYLVECDEWECRCV